jgi:hypothetical protein
MKKSQPVFSPYDNEADVVHIGQLSIENRVDRVSLHGDVDLTRDKAGLAHAKALQALLAGVISRLESESLPDVLPPPAVGTVPNPFG